MLGTLGTPLTAPAWKAVGWLLGPLMFRHDPADLLATLAAEDTFDLTEELSRIQTPVLVVGGDRDRPYGPVLLAETARRLPRGRLLLYPHCSHVGVPGRRRFVADVLAFLHEDAAVCPAGDDGDHGAHSD
jgi:pimeloyl-ACP methyl ester carboxylesterase